LTSWRDAIHGRKPNSISVATSVDDPADVFGTGEHRTDSGLSHSSSLNVGGLVVGATLGASDHVSADHRLGNFTSAHLGIFRSALTLLAPVCNCFTKGFDTPLLQDTKALLDQLA
jgi:hypothetical protein